MALADRAVSKDSFIFQSTIGQGGFGKVVMGMYLNDCQWYAVKCIEKAKILKMKTGLSMLYNELKSLQNISHQFIVELKFAFNDRDYCYLVLDLHSGGDLRHYLDKKVVFTEQQVALFVACTASALHFIHSQGVIHRDIKPDNIILDSHGFPHLSDFGVAHVTLRPGEPHLCRLASGTKQYLAPEVFTKLHVHGPAVDFWSLGVMAFELLLGERPFSKHCPVSHVVFLENCFQAILSESRSSCAPAHSSLGRETFSSDEIANSLACSSSAANSSTRLPPPLSPDSVAMSSSLPTQFQQFQLQQLAEATDERIRCKKRDLEGAGGPARSVEADLMDYRYWDDTRFDDGTLNWSPSARPNKAGRLLSLECADLVKGLMNPRPHRRVGYDANFPLLQSHPWFRSHGIRDWTFSNRTNRPPSFLPTDQHLGDSCTRSTIGLDGFTFGESNLENGAVDVPWSEKQLFEEFYFCSFPLPQA